MKGRSMLAICESGSTEVMPAAIEVTAAVRVPSIFTSITASCFKLGYLLKRVERKLRCLVTLRTPYTTWKNVSTGWLATDEPTIDEFLHLRAVDQLNIHCIVINQRSRSRLPSAAEMLKRLHCGPIRWLVKHVNLWREWATKRKSRQYFCADKLITRIR